MARKILFLALAFLMVAGAAFAAGVSMTSSPDKLRFRVNMTADTGADPVLKDDSKTVAHVTSGSNVWDALDSAAPAALKNFVAPYPLDVVVRFQAQQR